MKYFYYLILSVVLFMFFGCDYLENNDKLNVENKVSVNLRMEALGSEDVVGFHMQVSCFEQEGDTEVVYSNSEYVNLEEQPMSEWLAGEGSGEHAFADLFTMIPPGLFCCLEATPLIQMPGPHSKPIVSDECESAKGCFDVHDNQTTEIVIWANCGNPVSAGDVVVGLNDAPTFELDYHKFVCVNEELTLNLNNIIDPNGDDVTINWEVISGPGSYTLNPLDAIPSIFVGNEAGEYTLQVTVTDVHGAATALTFPVHVMDCGCACPQGYDLIETADEIICSKTEFKEIKVEYKRERVCQGAVLDQYGKFGIDTVADSNTKEISINDSDYKWQWVKDDSGSDIHFTHIPTYADYYSLNLIYHPDVDYNSNYPSTGDRVTRFNYNSIWTCKPGSNVPWTGNNSDDWLPINNPDNTPAWIGFSYCIGVETPGTYLIGMGGDNRIRFSFDEIDVSASENFTMGSSNKNFRLWHMRAINIDSGSHIVKLEGHNNNQWAGFSAEIIGPFDPSYFGTDIELKESMDNLTNDGLLNPVIFESKVVFATHNFIYNEITGKLQNGKEHLDIHPDYPNFCEEQLGPEWTFVGSGNGIDQCNDVTQCVKIDTIPCE